VKHATVLGASGFIGSHLSNGLAQRGFDVSIPARDADLANGRLGTVFYCIGLTGDAPRRPLETVDAHVGKLSDVLRRCRFDELIYLSSTRLYLGAPTGREDETLRIDPADPGRLFNLSKAAGESLILDAGRPARIARLSNVYGPDWEAENFLSTVITAACRDGAVTIRDAPESTKDYLHVQDAVDALIHIASEAREALYNVASGQNLSHREIAEELARVTGAAIEFGPEPKTVAFPSIDTSRLRAEFQLSPRGLLDDLPELVAECRDWIRRSGAQAAER
jgi:nucleoside-diphosphate-sugar epimerase